MEAVTAANINIVKENPFNDLTFRTAKASDKKKSIRIGPRIL